jgi:hypothetical protein
MKKACVAAFLLLATLSGCGATSLPSAPTPGVTASAQPKRHVLEAGGAALWGVNFSMKWQQVRTRDRYTGERGFFEGFTASPVFAGKGELIPLSHDRYVYQVPEDQVLVINQIEGAGVIFINGYGATAYGEPLTVNYVFGPGELVGIRFHPQSAGSTSTPESYYYESTTRNYTALNISGYVADPSLFSGAGANKAK